MKTVGVQETEEDEAGGEERKRDPRSIKETSIQMQSVNRENSGEEDGRERERERSK